MSDMETELSAAQRIAQGRDVLGSRLTIMAHHYQNDTVVRHADVVGDSLELARRIPDLKTEFIMFCGVYFMAETAAILARQMPDAEKRRRAHTVIRTGLSRHHAQRGIRRLVARLREAGR